MKHFIKKHAPHFGLWALSALLLLISTFWLNRVNQHSSVPTPKVEVITTPATSTISALPAKEKIKPSAPEQKISAPAEPVETIAPAEENKISISFKFIAPDWTKDATLSLPENKTVYDALAELVKENKISVEFKHFSGIGFFVQAIDGLAPKDNKYWIYYLNGKTANVGISFTKLKNSDVITWRYETPNF
jgi:hypothetical protein